MGKIRNWENFEFLEPPLKTRNISLKHLKLPKNHSKTSLFFSSTEVCTLFFIGTKFIRTSKLKLSLKLKKMSQKVEKVQNSKF